MNIALLFLSVDFQESQSSDALQYALMKQLISVSVDSVLIGTLAQMELINDDKLIWGQSRWKNPCSWKGVYCGNDRTVLTIQWGPIPVGGNINIDWLPSTLKIVQIQLIDLGNSTLRTRRLPRMLRFCSFNRCSLFGSVDLRTLPPQLVELHLGNNAFTGTVSLTNLPESMRLISFSKSEISKIVVCNEMLPEQFIHASFFEQGKKTSFVCLDGGKVDSRVNTNGLYIETPRLVDYE